MQSSKKFAFDFGITFIASIFSMLLSFFITVFLGRYLGAEDLGLYRMASTIYGIFILFVAFGIPTALIKYVAEYKDIKDKSNTIVSAGIITSLIFGIVFSVLFYLSSGIFAVIFNMPELLGLLKLLSPVFPFALIGGALLGLLNGLREMKKYGIVMVVQGILMVIVTIPLIFFGFGVFGAIIGMVFSSIGSCLFSIWVSRGYFEISLNDYIQATKEILKFGWKIVAVNGINQINYQADTILVGYFLTVADVGYYGVAISLSKFIWLIPQAVQIIAYPATSEYWANRDRSALQMMTEKSMKYTACILLPIGLGIGFFANDIVTLIFGKNFIYAVVPLQILIIGTIIFGIFISVGSFLTGIGRPDLSLKINGIGAIINLILNIALIPILGISGAAIATLISFIAIIILSMYLMIKVGQIKINAKPYAQLFIITILAILLYVALKWINIYLIGGLILGVYLLLIFMFIFTKEDQLIFKSFIYSATHR